MDSPVSCHYAVTCVLKKIRTKRVCIPTTSSCMEMIGCFRYQPNNSFHAAGLFLHLLKFKKSRDSLMLSVTSNWLIFHSVLTLTAIKLIKEPRYSYQDYGGN